MNYRYRRLLLFFLIGITVLTLNFAMKAQEKISPEILSEKETGIVVPTSFYFAGQSAPTQIRNSAAVRLGKDRHVIAGLVDTSGYSTEISGKYEGFFITDSPINLGGKTLETGAYGFGFSAAGKLHIFDLSSKEILSIETKTDAELKRPRPLMISVFADGVRFYKGKNYVFIKAK